MKTHEDTAITMARADFVTKADEAFLFAGGCNWKDASKMTLGDAMRHLAQNGLRLTYRDEWHMNNYQQLIERLDQ